MARWNSRTRSTPRRPGFRAGSIGLFLLAACNIYDSGLIDGDGAQQSPLPDAAFEAGMDAGDADTIAMDAGDGAVSECRSSDGELCDEICPETCDGEDDDCDGKIDEAPAGDGCGLDHASSVCVDGECLIAACDEHHVDCNRNADDGCEASLDTPDNCGFCGNKCRFPNVAVAGCDGESCTVSECREGFGDCDGIASNGCETELSTVRNCGACGRSCSIPNAISACEQEACVFSLCKSGWGDCNGDVSSMSRSDAGSVDGCEADLRDQAATCGGCDVSCSGDAPFCNGGLCDPTDCSEPAYADCDDEEGCETDLRPSEPADIIRNCGLCGATCGEEGDHATMTCADGECGVDACDDGYDDCDANPQNGCETDTRSLAHCGGCDQPCSIPNAVVACDSGSCEFMECANGFGDCNEDLADGCEQRLNTLEHCSTCDNACELGHADETCASGTCEVHECADGWKNCDGAPGNGCEVQLGSEAHCSDCNDSCRGDMQCSDGQCRCVDDSACPDGQTCCGGSCADPTSSEQHCGACGTACGEGETCCSGQCRDLQNDFDNCGECGFACNPDVSDSCSEGLCMCGSELSCGPIQRCCPGGCRWWDCVY